MKRIATLSYGIVCYAVFFATFLYAIGFIGRTQAPSGARIYLAGVSVSDERSMSTKGPARSFEPRELKWSLSRYR